MSTAKTLEIYFCRATEVHLPDQIVTSKLHYDGTRARRPAQFSLHNTVQSDSTFQVCSTASELPTSSLNDNTTHR